MTESNREESDQLPEEGPGGQVPDDDGPDTADENSGGADNEGQATGNPGSAGSDEEAGQEPD